MEIAKRPAEAGLVILSVLAGLLIVWLSSGLTFFQDEWRYILGRELTLQSVLRPTGEHWATLHVIAYRVLVSVFGLGSYLPFILLVVGLHLTAAAALYRLLMTVRPGLYALGGTVLFLFLGAGAENLLWAFQSGFVGAVMFGLWALVVVGERPRLAAVLLLLAVATHGPGLIFVVACAARAPRTIPWLILPVAAYGAWLVTFGTAGFTHPLTIGTLIELPGFVVTGITVAAGAMVGRYEFATGALFVLTASLALLIVVRRGEVHPLVRAGVVGLLAEFAIIGLVRGEAGASRYIYIAVPFMLLISSAIPTAMQRPRLALAFGAPAFVVMLAVNFAAFGLVRDDLARRECYESAVAPALRGTASISQAWPTTPCYGQRTVASPMSDARPVESPVTAAPE